MQNSDILLMEGSHSCACLHENPWGKARWGKRFRSSWSTPQSALKEEGLCCKSVKGRIYHLEADYGTQLSVWCSSIDIFLTLQDCFPNMRSELVVWGSSIAIIAAPHSTILPSLRLVQVNKILKHRLAWVVHTQPERSRIDYWRLGKKFALMVAIGVKG